MKQYELVVFDWDGTVMNSTGAIVEAIQKACADLDLAVPPPQTASWVIGLSLSSAMYRVVPDLQEEQLPLFIERYRHHFFQVDKQIALFDHARELLTELKENNVLIGVATGKSRDGLERMLAAQELEGFFDVTRCADEAFSKPHPAMLHQVMDVMGMQPQQVLMVGDTTHDIQMAHNAQVDGLGVSYGAHDRETLKESQPLAIVDTVPQLHDWLRQRVISQTSVQE